MSLDGIIQRLPEPLRPSRRFLHFLLIGALNTAVGYGLFVLFLWLGLHYALAAAFATVLGVLFNFKSTGGLVFKSKDNTRLPWFEVCMLWCISSMWRGLPCYNTSASHHG